jgi:hypothetical protein
MDFQREATPEVVCDTITTRKTCGFYGATRAGR